MVKEIDVNDISDDMNIIDVREPYEVDEAPFQGAVNIPLMELLVNYDKYLYKENKYYILCRSGVRSYNATQILTEEGYDVTNLAGGYIWYKD